MWFGFWGKKIYRFEDILDIVAKIKNDEIIIDENFEIYIDEDKIILKNIINNQSREFIRYNPYGKNESYLYIERDAD